MPLAPTMDDPGRMMSSPGMSAPAPLQENGSSPVDTQEQARGAVQVVGQLRKSTQQQLEAVATQFPSVAKEAKALQQTIDEGIQRLVKAIVKTVQTAEPAAPAALR